MEEGTEPPLRLSTDSFLVTTLNRKKLICRRGVHNHNRRTLQLVEEKGRGRSAATVGRAGNLVRAAHPRFRFPGLLQVCNLIRIH